VAARTAPDGAYFYEIWGTSAMPAPIDAAEPDPTVGALTVPPPNGGNGRHHRRTGPFDES
jgi:hypothetical protein